MDGDIGPLPALVEVAERHGAIMMIDDAHSSGVLGRNGRGTVDHFDLHGRVQIQVGTLSKAIGVLGGYVCGSRDLIEYSVPSCAAVSVFDVASAGRCRGLSRGFRGAGKRAGAHREAVGQHALFQSCSEQRGIRHRRERDSHHADHGGRGENGARFLGGAFRRGVFATGIGFPTVPEGKARVRTIVTATHTPGIAGSLGGDPHPRREEDGDSALSS